MQASFCIWKCRPILIDHLILKSIGWKYRLIKYINMDTVKAVLRGKFIAIQAYLKKQEKIQINNLTLHLKQLEKEEMKKPSVSRRKEILKIRAEINAIEKKRP